MIPFSVQVCICKCHIPYDLRLDKRCWNFTSNGDLSLKTTYDFKRNRGTLKDFWRWIWNKLISSSKSFLVLRLIHHKLPTNFQWKR